MKTNYSRKFVMATAALFATLSASFIPGALAQAASTDASATQQVTITPAATYFSVSGNAAQFKQDMGTRDSLAAGIQDFTLTRQIDDKTRVDFNGHAIFGNKDYGFDFKFQQDDLFKVNLGYKQFFTAYNGDGGYFTLNGKSAFGSDYASATNELGVTRGTLWLDIQTLLPNLPTFTLHLDRGTRTGAAGSTIMAGLGTTAVSGLPSRGILPAYNYIDEIVNTISLDINQEFNSFAYGAGVWGQRATTDDAIYYVSTPKIGATAGTTVGTGNNTTTDTGGAHAYVTGNIGKYITYGAGGLYNQYQYNINPDSGRYTYAGTDLIYDPINRANASSATIASMAGKGTYKEWEGSANLAWRPIKDLSIVPSVNFEDYRTDMMADYCGASLTSTTPTSLTTSNNNWFQATEKLEIRYAGLKNWTHTLVGEFDQGTGAGSFATYANPTTTNTLGNHSTTNQTSNTFKIAYTGNWYARSNLSFAGQVYYKSDNNDYDTPASSRGNGNFNYPGYMTTQGFKTLDCNIRMTWRPAAWISNVIRYDYQRSTVDTAYQNVVVTGTALPVTVPSVQSGKTQTHIISENLTITPHPRLSINLNCSLVFDQTVVPPNVYYASYSANPAATYDSGKQIVINADNNYFNGGVNATWLVNDQDTLTLDYTYYRAWNFVNNSAVSLPLGQDETQHIATLSWNRRLTASLDFTLGYTYAQYKNPTMGGNLDYTANGFSGSLRYKF